MYPFLGTTSVGVLPSIALSGPLNLMPQAVWAAVPHPNQRDKPEMAARIDSIDHWRMPPGHAARFSAHLWSYWERCPRAFAACVGDRPIPVWQHVADYLASQPFFDCLDFIQAQPLESTTPSHSCTRKMISLGYSMWSFWQHVILACAPLDDPDQDTSGPEDAARALRLLLAADAAYEHGDHTWHVPRQLCGLPFGEIQRELRAKGIGARQVLAADLVVVLGAGSTRIQSTLGVYVGEIKRPRIAPPNARCLVLLVLGNIVSDCEWASQTDDGQSSFGVHIQRTLPAGGCTTPRVVIVWATGPNDHAPRCRLIARCSRPRVCLRIVCTWSNPERKMPWLLDAESGLATCCGAVTRLGSHAADASTDTELLSIELTDVLTMLSLCGSASALLSTRRSCGVWRLPRGTCGCGCMAQGVSTGAACVWAGLPDLPDDEPETARRERINLHMCPHPGLLVPPIPQRKSKLRKTAKLAIECGGLHVDMSGEAMARLADTDACRAWLARFTESRSQ